MIRKQKAGGSTDVERATAFNEGRVGTPVETPREIPMTQQANDTSLVTLVLVVLAALLVLPFLFMGFGMMGFGTMMGGWEHGMWSGGAAPGWVVVIGAVMQLGFLVAVLAGLYLLYRFLTGERERTDPALEELRLAYARGELTDEEYQRRREALEGDSR